MTTRVDVDYLVVGAGAMGLAFTDALVDHDPTARVALVDRRHGVGGHWLEAYPFVRLHQASSLYGVASTRLGQGEVQQSGPERGLQERATQPEILAYYNRVLEERLLATGRVQLFSSCEHEGERTFVSRVSGKRFEVPEGCRIVDAHYLAPSIPAEKPAPFEAAEDARVLPVNALARLEAAAPEYVIAGAGKTATDAIVWLLGRGVDPDAITWVRPRDPWMFNRAVVQPEPAVFQGMVADIMESAVAAASLDDLFLRLEDAGIMLRIDQSVLPTMAKAPTLATWELDQLRTIEHVLRRGHLERVDRGKLSFADGAVGIAPDAVVVHCAADGLKYPPRIPVWGPEAITLQPIRAGFPCFGAALAGYVEATRDDDAEKNRLCPPSAFPDSLRQWADMIVLGTRAAMSFGTEPDIKAWADGIALNPARVTADHGKDPALDDARARIVASTMPALARLEELSR